MIVVGTAGHIDHGKTTLVRCLTGIETDRLKEEQQRGISIELGFAWLDLPGNRRIGLIDVPGHERFVHHMIAGATGVDLVLLVVAADEGVMPQTKEHVAICELLGMQSGLVVVTKTDLVEKEWLELVKEDLSDYLRSTFLAGAPILEFSSTLQGDALNEFRRKLYRTIEELAARVEKRSLDRPFMMPVDRVFTIKGFGTVVTGTVQSGLVRVGEIVTVLPSGLQTKVRRLEVHGRAVEESCAGTRTAANLLDVETEQIGRGNVLVSSQAVRAVSAFTTTIQPVPNLQVELKGQFKALFHTGSAMSEASVRLLDIPRLSAGSRGLAVVRLASPIAALPGNAYILRGFSAMADYGKTLGGGRILWPGPVKKRDRNIEMLKKLASRAPAASVEAASYLSRYSGVSTKSLPLLLPLPKTEIDRLLSSLNDSSLGQERDSQTRQADAHQCPGRELAFKALLIGTETRLFHLDFLGQVEQRLLTAVRRYHEVNPRKKGIRREELKSQLPEYIDRLLVQSLTDELLRSGKLCGDEVYVAIPGFSPMLDGRFVDLLARLENILKEGDVTPPDRRALLALLKTDDEVLSEALSHLIDAGKVIKISSDLYFHAECTARCREKLVDFLSRKGKATTQELKDLFGVSRKYLIPLVEYFDAIKVTTRVGTSERKLRGWRQV